MIIWQDFEKVDLRVGKKPICQEQIALGPETFCLKAKCFLGTIIEVEDFPEAKKPAYKLKINFGKELGIKNSSAQIVELYKKEELLGKQVVCVTNFAPKQIGKFMSEVLTTGFYTDKGVVLAVPDKKAENGSKLF